MAALCSTFMPLSVFGNLPLSRSAINPRSVVNRASSRSATNSSLKIAATKCSNANNVPPAATPHFHPSVWDGYDFTSNSKAHLIDERRLQELKKEVKNMLSLAAVAADSFQELDLIDKVQRLGVAYHFKDEIEYILKQTYNNDYTYFFDQNIRKDGHVDLCYVSLRFRLLRQAGYYVSTDVFKKFKDENSEFHANLTSDVQAILSLYEASYLGFRGEDIMDEAMNFSTKHLNSMLTSLSSSLALQVQHALTMPLQRTPERVYSRHYISIYQKDMSHNEILLKFATLDYNFVQMLHQKEINEVQKWWERIDLRSKQQSDSDFRSRVVEAYAITNNIYFEPQFSQGRIHHAKLWTILTFIDDAYDAYGSLDELELLCDAFQRWDANSTIELSDRMRIVFDEVLNFFNEIEKDMIKGGNIVGLSSLKELIQVQAIDLLKEIKVIRSRKIPTFEDWLSLSVPTAIGGPFVVLSSMNSRELATKEVFDWIATMPKVMKYSNMLTRLIADTASIKVEKERGVGCSSVPCYIKEHGVSESEAIDSLQKIISSLWKVLNEECLRVHPVPMGVIKNLLNYERSIAFYYAGVDAFSVSDGRTKEIITSMFINPIPI